MTNSRNDAGARGEQEEVTQGAPLELADYPTTVVVPVQWGDQDAFGHVNNAVALRWFETSRIAFLEYGGLGHLMSGHGLGPVVVSITSNYRRQLVYPDTVRIGTRVSEMGRTKMTLVHAVYSDELQTIAVDGQTVIVFLDFSTGRPMRLPAEVRERLRAVSSNDASNDASNP
jgi:acyl-CoA thioester hydrolase